MVWENPDFQSYFRGLLIQRQEDSNRDAQRTLQRFHADVGRIGAISGVHIAYAAGGYANHVVHEPAAFSIDAFGQACEALGLEPTEADYDQLRSEIETAVRQRQRAASQHLQQELARHAPNGSILANIAEQVASRAVRDCFRRIERLKLEVKYRAKRSPGELASQVAIVMSDVNSQARLHLGGSIFRITEPRTLVDIGQTPVTREELSHRLQSLAILIDQMDQETLRHRLDRAARDVPEGGINRLEAVLQAEGYRVPSDFLARLRDVRRLRNLYPAHPDDKDTLEAASRLGVQVTDRPEVIWERSLQVCLDAFTELARTLTEGPAGSG